MPRLSAIANIAAVTLRFWHNEKEEVTFVIQSIPLSVAMFCVECEVIFNVVQDGMTECPDCHSNVLKPLEPWLTPLRKPEIQEKIPAVK